MLKTGLQWQQTFRREQTFHMLAGICHARREHACCRAAYPSKREPYAHLALGDVHTTERMKTAGFKDVKATTQHIPCGSWPKDVDLKETGRFMFAWLKEAIHGFANKPFGEGLCWAVMDTDIYLTKILQELFTQGLMN